jgi:hypothetical protein
VNSEARKNIHLSDQEFERRSEIMVARTMYFWDMAPEDTYFGVIETYLVKEGEGELEREGLYVRGNDKMEAGCGPGALIRTRLRCLT